MEKLEACIRNHDKEIEKMCNFHHQGFVDAITELLKVRTDAEKLKVQVTDTNRRFQDAGKEVIVHTEDIIRCRIQQRNITTVVEKLQLCLPGSFCFVHNLIVLIRISEIRHSLVSDEPVLEMYSKLKEQMSAKRKDIEETENVYFPWVSQYRFCQLMIENLPKLREDIKEISMSDLKDFLESIRKHSDKIGETAMKQCKKPPEVSCQLCSVWQSHSLILESSRWHECKAQTLQSSSLPWEKSETVLKHSLKEEDENEEEDIIGIHLLLKSRANSALISRHKMMYKHDTNEIPRCRSPTGRQHDCLGQCGCLAWGRSAAALLTKYTGLVALLNRQLEISEDMAFMGDEETFENYYRKQRKKQARLVLQPQSNMHETVDGYRRYFTQISYCTDPDLVLELKNLIVIFADTLQEAFTMGDRLKNNDGERNLGDASGEFCEKFTNLVLDIFEEDNYSPIPIVNEEEYKIVISKFPFQDPDLEKTSVCIKSTRRGLDSRASSACQSFPKKFPMSQSVPHIYIQVKEFIYASLKFSESLHRSSTEIDDMLRKSTNLLLTRTLSSCLLNLIRKPHIGLTELVQIIINTTHLEQACKYLEDFITNITNISQETVHTTRLYGLSTFKKQPWDPRIIGLARKCYAPLVTLELM
ncbi:Exocyst complex component 6 [Saguinus oedipus]|uniref:Exocyst complex component 6 n=1 Tax=Saguinus oedipus TaxID=9490 RepID=A0ABQ9UPF8_SAGOE|nr:Exocyst complex component 6 [Saguinus oedipus]